MMELVYKSREEALLIESLSKSQLISKQQLLEIKKLYNENVPYHNFLHALKVAQWALKLPKDIYNITEVQSLFIAALFHDAGHTGIVEELDEFRSLDMASQGIINFEKKYEYSWINHSIVRQAIIGTVFKNRGKNKNPYAIVLADMDVSTIWMNFPEFLYYCDFPISVEFGKDIISWQKDVSYFKFLMSVDSNIFRNEQVRYIFPNALNNIKQYITLESQKMKKIYEYWRKNDISYQDFEIFYKKTIQ